MNTTLTASDDAGNHAIAQYRFQDAINQADALGYPNLAYAIKLVWLACGSLPELHPVAVALSGADR